jgi:hypothetical protein
MGRSAARANVGLDDPVTPWSLEADEVVALPLDDLARRFRAVVAVGGVLIS